MKRFLILATILISLVSVSFQQEALTEYRKDTDCFKVEGLTHLTGMVLDLYYNKISFGTFIEKYLEWGNRSSFHQIAKCFTSGQMRFLTDPSVLSRIGVTLLYAANCEKDLGPSLIILDQTIQMLQNVKTQWKTALLNAISLGLVSYQTYGDCRTALQNIKDIWTKN